MKKIRDLLHKLNVILDSKQKVLGAAVLLLSLFGAVLETCGVSAVLPFVSVMLSPESVVEEGIFSIIIKYLGITDYSHIVLIVGLFVILIFVFKNLYFIFLSWVRAKYACKIQREISVEMLKVYYEKNYSFFLNKNTGELIQEVYSDVLGVYGVLYQGLRLVTDSLIIILIFVYMLFTDIKLAFLISVLAGLCLVIIDLFFRKRMHIYGEIFRKYTAKSNQALIEGFQGIKEVLILRKQKYFIEYYEDNIIKQQKAQVSQNVGAECPAYIIEGVCVVGILLCISLRTTDAATASAAIPTLSAFVMGAFRILPSLGKISSALNGITYSSASLNAVYTNIMSLDKTPMIEKECEIKESSFVNEVELQNITFAYNKKMDNIIETLSLCIRKGQSIAFIGQSGAGKTTLADIILGLLIPDEGTVKMDGQEISQIPVTWSKTIGYVSQSVYISDSSIRNNIAFGIPDSEIDDEKIWKSLEQAQLKELVLRLPAGLDTKVGDRGVRFSGGQRQRLAIARALYHEPQILVLDEATSALDNETEKAVMEAIESLQGKMTLIIVAHRLSTVRKCDLVYEIKGKKAFLVDKEKLLG